MYIEDPCDFLHLPFVLLYKIGLLLIPSVSAAFVASCNSYIYFFLSASKRRSKFLENENDTRRNKLVYKVEDEAAIYV